MGIAIIGGLLFALVLTLYVVPALYSYLSRETSSTDATGEDTLLNEHNANA